MGLTREQIASRSSGVATCWNEAAPCNISLMRQAQAVKKGVAAANGTPREFCTITVTDGIAMGHQGMKASLPSREVIADSVELTMRGQAYDALVGSPGCDKSLPGMMMADGAPQRAVDLHLWRLDPARLVPRPARCTVQDLFEAVGPHLRRRHVRRGPRGSSRWACPSAGACGRSSPPTPWRPSPRPSALPLPYSAARPAPYEIATGSALLPASCHGPDRQEHPSARSSSPQIAGERRHGGRASGGSTNAALHLPAIAHEAGIVFDLFDVAEIFNRTPYIADLKPADATWPRTCFEVGGIPLNLKALLEGGFLHGDCMTVTRPHHGREPERAPVPGTRTWCAAPRRRSR
jgi:dihydroxy-acid dehydratase